MRIRTLCRTDARADKSCSAMPSALKRTLATSLILLAAFLSGCAPLLEEISDFRQGWRKAEVIQFGRASEITRARFTECLDSASTEQLNTENFAVLAYRVTGGRHTHVVQVMHGVTLRPGDVVFANVDRCSEPIEVLSRSTTPF